jgi:RNase H-fold protein (predicted Holliday junction resolvase)
MSSEHSNIPDQPTILGFDPGKYKCGLAVMGVDRIIRHHQIVDSQAAISAVQELQNTYPISLLVMGDQTTSQAWKRRLQSDLPNPLRIVMVDERNSTLEARDRYWQLYPPKGLAQLIPQALRSIPRPIDDIVAILLIERYLERLVDRTDAD